MLFLSLIMCTIMFIVLYVLNHPCISVVKPTWS
jgi:hypothetical protein